MPILRPGRPGAGPPEVAAGLEELRHLAGGHLVAVEPEVAHVDAVHGALVGGAGIAAHPERAGLDEHGAVAAPTAEPRRVHAVTRSR